MIRISMSYRVRGEERSTRENHLIIILTNHQNYQECFSEQYDRGWISGQLIKSDINSRMCIRSCHLSDHIILHHLITDADHILLILSLIGVGGEDQMQARFEDQIKKIIKRSNAGEGKVLYASEATTLTDPGQMRPLKKHQLKHRQIGHHSHYLYHDN